MGPGLCTLRLGIGRHMGAAGVRFRRPSASQSSTSLATQSPPGTPPSHNWVSRTPVRQQGETDARKTPAATIGSGFSLANPPALKVSVSEPRARTSDFPSRVLIGPPVRRAGLTFAAKREGRVPGLAAPGTYCQERAAGAGHRRQVSKLARQSKPDGRHCLFEGEIAQGAS